MRATVIDILPAEKGLFNVKIVIEGSEVFYADGEGGQLGDRGVIEGNQIFGAKKMGKDLWIVTDSVEGISRGKLANIEIDNERRKDISQQHTAQHLLTAVIKRELDAETLGFQMGEMFSTIDISLGFFTNHQRILIEDVVNREIQAGYPISINLYSPEEFNRLDLRMRKELSQKVLSQKRIRVVSIGEIDRNPCGGLHVNNTLEIGLLKITKSEKVKGELTRLYFVAGNRARKLFQKEHEMVETLMKELTCGFDEIPDRVSSLLESVKTFKSAEKRYTEMLAKYNARELEQTDEIVIVSENTPGIINSIPRFINKDVYIFIGITGDNKFTLAAKDFDLRELFEHLKQKHDVHGGCGPAKGQFVSDEEKERIIDAIKHWAERKRSYES
ncbi:hypothetical protein AT15_07310 [Kosmotoga arenicorallina S304]|uniref:Alanyl-transfer RNA synthetases family profile domain-containing protein n=1 Tax=Kosmotoga arenicorallina S304 TaxID=1453497 RepID=A0A182C7M3_9BACT|nr:alanyl-tRNA editing protein [Kosmotoga arenicorallina]OAA31297.1 hypothetical protein AT15_07310 [Kosmotoga arenicorallina S304]